MNKIRFSLIREVQAPQRAGEHEAGIDFFVPMNLSLESLIKANEKATDIDITTSEWPNEGQVGIIGRPVNQIILGPHSRIIIPSGVVVLIEPSNSMLIAANKSGISTKKGLVYGAQVVDSTYTGEIHIHMINTSANFQFIEAGDKLIQFIHTPIYNTKPVQISYTDFITFSKDWSDRGNSWQGSSDIKESKYQEGWLGF